MDTMTSINKYATRCTKAQVEQAFKLGALLTLYPTKAHISDEGCEKLNVIRIINNGYEAYYLIPTTEEMIGWLEKEKLYISIRYTCDVGKNWQADVDCANYIDPECGKYLVDFNFPSRKEATLAAINAALEYLSSKKH